MKKNNSSELFETAYPVKRGNRKQPDRDIKSDLMLMKQNEISYGKPQKLLNKERTTYKYKSNSTSTFLLPSVALSEIDKAAQLKLSRDQLTLSGAEGGYRMVRATHGVHRGSYYWEIEILDLSLIDDSINAHVRVGWSTRQGELQAPVGFDRYSYGYGDVKGYINIEK